MAGRVARNYTPSFELETRQHKLFIDLGEGPPRKPLIFGIVVFAIWVGLAWLVLGTPTKTTSTIFLVPPILLSVYGARPAPNNKRRFRFTAWLLAAGFMLSGHRPIINLGRRQPSRAELTPWNQRRASFPWSNTPAWERPQTLAAPIDSSGPPVRLSMKARLLGNDHVAGVLQHRAARTARKTR